MGRPRKPLTEQRGNLTVITMQTREAEEDSVTTDKNQLKRPPTWHIEAALTPKVAIARVSPLSVP